MILKALIPAAAVAALLSGAAFAEENTDVSSSDKAALTAPLQRLVDSINQANKAVPKDVFAPDSVVLDDFPPYHWHGKTDAGDWYKGLVDNDDFAEMKAKVKIGAPSFARINDDDAYVVFPSTYDFLDEDGKPAHQTGQWVIIEHKVSGNWLIAGHSWAITSDTTAK